MSWSTCYSGSNNIHFNFPPIMNDGRNYASWQPGAVINEQIREKNNIKSNWQYREYLTRNADEVMSANFKLACDNCGSCPPMYGGPQNPSTQANSPYVFSSALDNSQPFGYQHSDLKNLYLSRYELQSRMVAPALTQDQYLMQGYPNPN